jgi:2-C-methyl-D-erythritol 4-phosphate cytidylyltransferase
VIWAIVVAAGSGTRYGGPKQFAAVGGRPMVEWAVEQATAVADGVVLVVPPDGEGEAAWPAVDAVVPGGATRSDSVRAGLAAVPDAAEVIVVHDAARPLATRATFDAVVAALDHGDAAVPVMPLPDSLRHVDDGPVDRGRVVAVQTPQAFRARVLRRAHAGGEDATDDATLVERVAGGKVILVPGERRAMKVTTPQDVRVLEALIEP